MKRLATALLAGAVLIMISQRSYAAGNSNARLALHFVGATAKNPCIRALVPCHLIVTSSPLYPDLRFACVLVTGGSATEGISGVQFGIQYSGGGPADGIGLDVFSWVKCTDLEFQSPSPAWPSSGGGNLMTWFDCQTIEPGGAGTGAHAVAGYFYCSAYTADCLSLTPRPIDNATKVVNCAAVEDVLPNLPQTFGAACFGSTGFNPACPEIPVESTTWSGIKSIYAN